MNMEPYHRIILVICIDFGTGSSPVPRMPKETMKQSDEKKRGIMWARRALRFR
jgi:hypothetical protein